ncbi:NINE protein [Synechococcus sp. PCC 7336]|uniref:NINE protein n=1 Tax=Synechococcus sp. PCC 7336 TaxID=195250 RepID=UPI00034BF6DE|nr:NINE protein [Synechococcus sp. PCC 7336]
MNWTPSGPPKTVIPQKGVGTAYGLWCLSFFGLCGIHRIYAGKYVTGIVWLLTLGLFGLGQFIDLFLIPDMVNDFNLRQRGLYASLQPSNLQPPAPKPVPLKGEALMRRILQLAAKRQGVLTVTEAIAALEEAEFDDIEAAFLELELRGYAASENDFDTGVVLYRFTQLDR